MSSIPLRYYSACGLIYDLAMLGKTKCRYILIALGAWTLNKVLTWQPFLVGFWVEFNLLHLIFDSNSNGFQARKFFKVSKHIHGSLLDSFWDRWIHFFLPKCNIYKHILYVCNMSSEKYHFSMQISNWCYVFDKCDYF